MRREVVGGLSERILRARGWHGTFSTTADPHAALEGADFVVVQLRIGGQAARHVDETLPVGYGCLGQETTGAGGLAKALRTVPVVLELAEEMAARSNRGAWLVDFTNPVGIVTQACSTRATTPWACATSPSGPSDGSGTISASIPMPSRSSTSA